MSRAWPSESMTLIASRISIGTSANLLLGPQLVQKAALFHLLYVAHVHEFLRLYLLRPRVNLSDLIQDRLQRLALEDEPGLHGLGVRRSGHSGHLDIFAQQSREAFRITAALDKAKIPARLHAEAPERLNGKIVGVAADAAYGDLLAPEVFGLLPGSSRHDALRHDVFYAADEDQVRGALNVGADIADPAGQGHLGVAAKHCRSDHAGRGDINQLKVEIVLFEEIALMGDRRPRL